MVLDFRQNGIIAVTGQTGVGKSYTSNLMVCQYVKDNTITQKHGRKAIILDVTEDPAYAHFHPIPWSKIKQQPNGTVYRLQAKYPNGTPLKDTELVERYYYLMDVYKGGLILLEDWNKYGLDTKNQKALGPLTTARHNGCDIVFSMQNMSKITREIWENISLYRFHAQLTSVDSQKRDIDDFEMLKIAEIIVNEQFNKVTQLRRLGKIDELTYKKYASFYVWVDFRRKVIEGCQREQFIKAAYRLINADPLFWNFCRMNNLNHRKPDEYQQAVKLRLSELLRFYSAPSK